MSLLTSAATRFLEKEFTLLWALPRGRQRAQNERRQFEGVFAVGPVFDTVEVFFSDAGELLELDEKQRRIERPSFDVLRRAGDHEAFPGARANDVRVVTFLSNLLMRPGTEPD